MSHKRRFVNEAAVVALGVQTPQDRWSKRQRRSDYEDSVPPILGWRCQLTGLSQTSNHYFVACADQIFVYRPHFSTQALPRDPALIVTSQPSTPGLQGYLQRQQPHAINNLVVHFLGTEEVVAAVRDDGDVDAFLVRHIVQAIERRAEGGNSIDVKADDVRPIFQSNVGLSAWGLAIHAEARIIAVSANTKNITIFKFALVDVGDEDEDVEASRHSSGCPRDREMDVAQQVLNGTSNIPHIAFCNTGDDPEGRWLLTTDITGFCRSIDLCNMQPAQTFRFGRPITYFTANDHDPINSGWFVGFLDRRSFIQTDSVHAALGMKEGDALPCKNGSNSIWDIGDTVAHIANTSSKFPSRRRNHARSQSALQANIPTPVTQDQSIEASSEWSPLSQADTSEQSDMSDQDQADTSTDLDMDDPEVTPEGEAVEASSNSEGSMYWTDGMDLDDEGTEDSPSFRTMYEGRKIWANQPRQYQPYNKVCGDLPCPILHASVRTVYLLQPSPADQDVPFTYPTVGFTNALHQLVRGEMSYLNTYERLNLHAYIPTLGIVVLASQKGRAIVLSLTKLNRKSAQYPPGMEKLARESCPRTTYAMRFEHILPFSHQEDAGARPMAPLAGIATGPMQGTENFPDEQKRWRLMMYYMDHTILSYEIKRRRARDYAVDIGGIAV